MRVAPEAVDDGFMPVFKLQAVSQVGMAGEQPHRFLVIRRIFTVHQRHVKERPLLRCQLLIRALGHRFMGQLTRQVIVGKGGCLVSKHVSWKLVQYDDFSKTPFGCFAPGGKFAGHGLLVGLCKPVASFLIERRVLAPPMGPHPV